MKNNCHNRPEFPDTTIVQDGWTGDIENMDFMVVTRQPVMKKIHFSMSKMADGCKQWEKPYGAVVTGVLSEEGCEGCKWKPSDD